MSQILRALGRGRRPRGDQGGSAPGRDDDAVLAGLGVRSSPQPAPSGSIRPVVLGLLGVVLLAGGIFAVNVIRDRGTAGGATSNDTARAVPQVGPEEPVAPGKGPESPPVTQAAAIAETEPEAPPVPVVRTAPAAAQSPAPSERMTAVPREPAAVSAPAPPPAPGVDHFKLALYYQQTGDFENALSHYGMLLQRDPLNAEAHNNLGLLYKQNRLLDKAITEFEKALSINPKYVMARNNLAVTFLEAGRAEAAAAQLRAILASDSDNVDALVNLALALSAMKQDGAAEQTLMKAIGIEPRHAAAHYNLARMYEEERENAKALERYRSFLQYAGPEHTALVPEVSRRIAALEKKQGG